MSRGRRNTGGGGSPVHRPALETMPKPIKLESSLEFSAEACPTLLV